jgi:DNA-binding winged helix-turn-helix (wHTH) protein/tetratricopeptide (TPR) repeat protein
MYEEDKNLYEFGARSSDNLPFLLDPTERLLKRSGQIVSLSETERKLLHTLIRRPDHLFTRDDLLREVWQDDQGRYALNRVDYTIHEIRRKLGWEKNEVIETVHGEGYRFVGTVRKIASADDQVKILSPLLGLQTLTEAEKDDVERCGKPDRESVVGLRFLDIGDTFKDRMEEVDQLRQLLSDNRVKLVCIVGRGGMGKTALLSKLCAEIERGDWRLTPSISGMGVDGIVYFSCRGADQLTVDRLVHDIGLVLDESDKEEVIAWWCDTSRSLNEKIKLLLSKMRRGCYLLAIDNMEDALAPDNTIADSGLREFFECCLTTPHGMRLLATSRKRPAVHRPTVRVVTLDDGIPNYDAAFLLRDLDPDGDLGLRDAPDELLLKAADRCFGIPRAIEIVAGILVEDPTISLPQLLNDGRLFNKQVVENLVVEHYHRLNEDQRRIIETLAVYNKPVPAVAVRYLLQPFFLTVEVESQLKALVRNYFIKNQRGCDTYELHPLDQEYAYAQVPDEGNYTKAACHLQAASFYAAIRKPLNECLSFTDLQPQRDEIYHLIKAQAYDSACESLESIEECLIGWGHYLEVYNLRTQLSGHLSSYWESKNAVELAECLYQGLDQWDEALDKVKQVELTYEVHGDEMILGEARQIHAHIAFERGQFNDALAIAHENLQRFERVGLPLHAANALNSLGVFLDAVGKWGEAISHYEQARTIFEADRVNHEIGRVLINRSVADLFLHGPEAGLDACQRGIMHCSQSERPQEFAYGKLNLALYNLALGNLEDVQTNLEQCYQWAKHESWFALSLKEVESTLYRLQGRYDEALSLLDAVLEPFIRLEDNWAEIDCAINKGCILMDIDRGAEAIGLWRKALRDAQENDYYLGIRMSAYLLFSSESEGDLQAEEFAREFERHFLPHFNTVFMPCYVLSLRAKSICHKVTTLSN